VRTHYLVHSDQHTKASIGKIVANEVGAFSGLPSHESEDLFV
jgi:hypothetical protein